MVDHHVFHGERRLTYLPEKNRALQPEVDYFREHGVSRAEGAACEQAWQQQEFEAKVVADLAGEPPEAIADTKNLAPERARYVKYVAWCQHVARELVDLEQKKADLEAMVAAVAPAKAARWAGVRQTADTLLGRDGGSEVDAKALAERVAIAEHRGEAAKIALQELEREIECARLRARHLEGREPDFLNPLLVEIADQAGLGAQYVKAIEALRGAASLVFGLAEMMTYGSGFGRATGPISFPGVNFPSIGQLRDGDLTISHRGSDVWRQMVEALRSNPRQSFDGLKPAPLPAGGYSCWPWGK